jgi:CheY-like chemotaxis protein
MSLITLIIDDDPIMCFIHTTLLHQNQIAHDPIILANGQEALNYLLKNYDAKEEYLILLDIHMPIMNGLDFLQEIKQKFKGNNLHVLIVSSSIQVAEQEIAKSFTHVVDFMEKPLKRENLEKIKILINSLTISPMKVSDSRMISTE